MTYDASDSIRNRPRRVADRVVHVKKETLRIPDTPCHIEVLYIIKSLEVLP
jgi:hypothetical protein